MRTKTIFLSGIVSGFCLFSNLQGGIFTEDPWRIEMRENVQNILKSIVPENQWEQWQGDSKDSIFVASDRACGIWGPTGESKEKYTESLTVVLGFKPNRIENRQFKDINEALEACKHNYRGSKIEWKCTQISDLEAIVEGDVKNEDIKFVERKILSGNWLISMEYEHNFSNDKADSKDWAKQRDFWIERFRSVQFN